MSVKQNVKDPFHLAHIVNVLPGNVYWKAKDGRYLGCNDNMAAVVGIPAKDMIGKRLHELLTPDKWPVAKQIEEEDQLIMSSGQEKMFEEVGYDIRGNAIIYLTHKKPLFDEHGVVVGLIGVSFEIDERKQHERRLTAETKAAKRQSKINSLYLQNIITKLPEGIYWMDEQGRFLGCNARQAEVFGVKDPKLLKGKNIYEAADMLQWDKTMADDFYCHNSEVLQTGRGQIFKEIVMINGKKHTYLSYKDPLRNDHDEIAGIISIAIDVTDKENIIANLQHIMESITGIKGSDLLMNITYLEHIISKMPGNVYWKDKQGRYLGCNDSMANVLHLSSRYQIVGKTVYELLPDEWQALASKIDEEDRRIMEDNQETSLTEEAFNANNEIAYYVTKKTPLHDHKGEVVGMLGTSVEVSGPVNAEKDLQKEKIKDK